MKRLVPLNFNITDIQFLNNEGSNFVRVNYQITFNQEIFLFFIYLVSTGKGNWQVVNYKWYLRKPNIDESNLIQKLINQAHSNLKTTNLWSGEQKGKNAQIYVNEEKVPDSDLKTNSTSFRFGMLSIPSPPWSELWKRIKLRVLFDDYFRVHGFDSAEVLDAIGFLEGVFSPEWVQSKYKKWDSDKLGHMNIKFDPKIVGENWFPAYHLARTANGSICVDSGWNYLIEIGLSIKELNRFEELNTLKSQLTRSSGIQHQICLASELFRRGLLIGLEEPTGSGSATNDLLVEYKSIRFAVEVKELSSKKPLKRLKKELNDKAKKLPTSPEIPTIFHVVLTNSGGIDPNKKMYFLKKKDEIEKFIPDKVSAVILGTRFIDSTGGRIKWETANIICNENAINPIDEKDLKAVFKNNFSKIVYPVFEMGTFFYFEN